jgi:hypothetical protein
MALGSGIRDPGSGIRKKPIPDPGSRGQKRHRIPDPDPQHLSRRFESMALTGKSTVGIGSGCATRFETTVSI